LLSDDAFESCLELASNLSPYVSLREVEVYEGRVYVQDGISSIKSWNSEAFALLCDHVDVKLNIDFADLGLDSSRCRDSKLLVSEVATVVIS